ncbi:hypothetical protein QMK49_00365 [Pseudomonas sp. P8_250]|nr:hypothetical protein [Pseudomonas sp. P8_250]MDX9668708.1 hypothetical protein [Pseudomonas sp. P8_250]
MPDNRAKKNRPDSNRPEIAPEKVKQLRELTGEGMMDCKKALMWAKGDMDKAKQHLLDMEYSGCRLVYYSRPESSYTKAMKLMQEIWANMPPDDKLWFRKEEPIRMHNSLGMHLRNHANMWEFPWTPEIRGGIDFSKDHPDAISMRVIEDFQQIIRAGDAS